MNLTDVRREFREIPIGLIDEPALASRSSMDDARMEELVESIRAIGLQQPIIVARAGERYEVVAGHRRRIACGLAGNVAIPCLVYPSRDVALEAVKVAENAFREEWNPADQAIYYAELLEQLCAGDVDRLCDLVKRKRAHVESRLLLFQGDARVFEELQRDRISIGVAHELNKCTAEEYRRYLLHQAIVGGATVAVVSGWVIDWKASQRAVRGEPAAAAAAPAPAAVPQLEYFRCACCQGTDNVHLMQPINVHQHCKLAILDKALEQYHRRGELLTYPRTLDEAVTLVNDLVDRFPQILEQDARRI